MSFYTNAVISPDDGGWLLVEPLVWEIGTKGSGNLVTIDAGFHSDLATIPPWARWWLDPADPCFAKAALLHDAMLAQEYSPVTAAAEFYKALRADRVGKFKATIMALAVLQHTTR